MPTSKTPDTVVITGGANGLGFALAKVHVARGDRVVLVDRDAEQGKASADALAGNVHFFACDLTQVAECETLASHIKSVTASVSRLYNNAGIAGSIGTLKQQTDANWEAVFGINVFAPARLTRLLLPLLAAARRARVVNVASMAGLLSASHMSAYSASKAALVSLSETLHKELQPGGIGVTVACPAFFKTRLTDSIPPQESKARASVEKLMANGKLSADQVAQSIVGAADRGQFMVLPHARERWLWYLKRLSYRALHAVMMSQQPAPAKARPDTGAPQ
ncbi:SDR family NAD(P)-dependent oxidoreductase [Saccharospirillum alexandrii]|uniref:SDR family NAD(P)-dependent oxidoreductase n=1 Tax=Saccharospirillum alexandrii TaxID=2448477 RepID=UPI000FD8CAA9|nr:SDR family NAD(P)-dependent oxidoreductase [Saccharospirillum alexandrii]